MPVQQFHLRKARALRVGFPFSSRIAPCIPPILAQKDLRRFADLDPAFNLEGGVVTAIFNLLPGFSAREDLLLNIVEMISSIYVYCYQRKRVSSETTFLLAKNFFCASLLIPTLLAIYSLEL